MAEKKKLCGTCGTEKVKPFCIPCHDKAVRRWQKKNPQVVKAASARWRKKHAAKKTELQLAYQRRHPELMNARNAARRATKKSAVAGWANHFFMREAYHLAQLRTKMLGFPWHVDHIVPLKSQLVCGLHVHNNLQVIPGVENHRKNNLRWPDIP